MLSSTADCTVNIYIHHVLIIWDVLCCLYDIYQVCPYPCVMEGQVSEETLIQNTSQCEDSESVGSRKDSPIGSASRWQQQQHQLQERKLSLKQWESSGPTQKETDQWSHEEAYENYTELYKYCEVNISVSFCNA